MATPRQDTRTRSRLYLVTPPVDDPAAAAAMLGPALAAADIAAVLLRLAGADERALINHVKALAPLVQDRGAALLLDGRPDLVARTGADGAHLTGIDALKDAIGGLKPDRIAGASGLSSRHDAMLAAEAGADYVMFGEPRPDGARPSFEAVVERVLWWTEVFEIPCVAYAANHDEVGRLRAAEFVALGDFVFRDPRGSATAVAQAAGHLMTESLA